MRNKDFDMGNILNFTKVSIIQNILNMNVALPYKIILCKLKLILNEYVGNFHQH